MGFMEDIEEDPTLREKINIYRDATKAGADVETEIPDAPTLSEMLEDLQIKEDAEMADAIH